MPGIKMTFNNGDKMGQQLKIKATKFDEKRTLAIQSAARRTASDIETAGRQNIAAGGDFGSERWQQGFRALVSYQSRSDLRIRVTHAVSYWKVFEYGAKILGKPLLWIPLSFSAAGKLAVRARDFPGQLFRVDRKGKAPLLLSDAGPEYFGKESVRIPKKWTLREIVKEKARLMKQYYQQAMKNG
jgi:hypothetical protein